MRGGGLHAGLRVHAAGQGRGCGIAGDFLTAAVAASQAADQARAQKKQQRADAKKQRAIAKAEAKVTRAAEKLAKLKGS